WSAIAASGLPGSVGLGAAGCEPEHESPEHKSREDAASTAIAPVPNCRRADIKATSHARHYPGAGGRTRLPHLRGSRYLNPAQTLFARCTAGWDDACGGGLRWNTTSNYNNAITNELFLTLAALPH